ncbi:MAG: hypothetical protein ACE149_13185 [Armatimonadota bacterium]
MSTVILTNDRPRPGNGVPPPRGATLASFALFTTLSAFLALLYAGSEWWHLAGGFGFPTDTAWVRAVIARNLATGGGISFNPGVPAAGAAGSSWIVALALGGLAAGNYVVVAKVLGVIAVVLAACLAWAVALNLLGDWRFAFVAGLAVVASPLMVSQGLGGTEAAWAALWLIGTIHWQASGWEGGNRARTLASVALGLACLSRPELIVLFPLALADRWVMVARRDPPGKRLSGIARSLPELAGAAAVIAPFVVYNLRSGGPWWQQPSLALRQPPIYAWALEAVRSLFLENPALAVAALVGVPVAALFALRDRSRHPSLLLVLTTLTVIVAPQLIWRQASPDSAVFTATYLTPMIAVLGSAGMFLVYRWAQRPGALDPGRGRGILVPATIAIGCVAVFGYLAWTHPVAWRQHGFQVKKVSDLQGYIGRWAAEHLAADASVASREVGAIAFYSRRRMVDLGGTTSRDALPYMGRPGSPDTNLLAYLEKSRPSHLAIRPSDFPSLAQRGDLLTPVVTCFVKDPITGGETTMALYETPWPPLSVVEAKRQARGER